MITVKIMFRKSATAKCISGHSAPKSVMVIITALGYTDGVSHQVWGPALLHSFNVPYNQSYESQ